MATDVTLGVGAYSVESERTTNILVIWKIPTAVPSRVTVTVGEAVVSVTVLGLATTDVDVMCDTVTTSLERVGMDCRRSRSVRLFAAVINISVGTSLTVT